MPIPMLSVTAISFPMLTVFTSSRIEKRSSWILGIYCCLMAKKYLSFSIFFTMPFIPEMYLLILRSISAVKRDLRTSSTLSSASS